MSLVNEYNREKMIDLKEYWTIVMKSKWKIIGFLCLTTLVATVIVMSISPVYRATSSLLIKASRDNTVSIDSVYSLDTSRKDYFSTQFAILKSRAVTEQVIDELQLALHPEFLPDEKQSLLTQAKSYIKSLIPEGFLPQEQKKRCA